MYVIEFEDLEWISEAHTRLGDECHKWLMVRWLRDHDVWALMCLISVGLYLKGSKSTISMVLSQVKGVQDRETITQHKEKETQ